MYEVVTFLSLHGKENKLDIYFNKIFIWFCIIITRNKYKQNGILLSKKMRDTQMLVNFKYV